MYEKDYFGYCLKSGKFTPLQWALYNGNEALANSIRNKNYKYQTNVDES